MYILTKQQVQRAQLWAQNLACQDIGKLEEIVPLSREAGYDILECVASMVLYAHQRAQQPKFILPARDFHCTVERWIWATPFGCQKFSVPGQLHLTMQGCLTGEYSLPCQEWYLWHNQEPGQDSYIIYAPVASDGCAMLCWYSHQGKGVLCDPLAGAGHENVLQMTNAILTMCMGICAKILTMPPREQRQIKDASRQSIGGSIPENPPVRQSRKERQIHLYALSQSQSRPSVSHPGATWTLDKQVQVRSHFHTYHASEKRIYAHMENWEEKQQPYEIVKEQGNLVTVKLLLKEYSKGSGVAAPTEYKIS